MDNSLDMERWQDEDYMRYLKYLKLQKRKMIIKLNFELLNVILFNFLNNKLGDLNLVLWLYDTFYLDHK